MADVFCIVNRSEKLSVPTRKVQLPEPLAYSNAQAHALRFNAYNDDGTDADLTGVGVVGNFMKADGNTVTPITGTASGNVAQVILPESCYLTPGRFKFTMDLTGTGGTARTALWVEGIVEKNISGTIIDPGTPVGNIAQAIGQANAAATAANEAAAAAAEAAADAEGVTSAIAPTFAEVMAEPFVPLGAYEQHAWKDGTLYVNKVDIETAEAWNANHWEACDVSGELYRCLHESDIATLAEMKEYLNITD